MVEWYFSWHSVVLQKDGTELWWLWVFGSVPCEEHDQHCFEAVPGPIAAGAKPIPETVLAPLAGPSPSRAPFYQAGTM